MGAPPTKHNGSHSARQVIFMIRVLVEHAPITLQLLKREPNNPKLNNSI